MIYSPFPLFRPAVGVFQVLEDTPAAFALVKANPALNPDNYPVLPQIYIPSADTKLRRLYDILSKNRAVPTYPGLPPMP